MQETRAGRAAVLPVRRAVRRLAGRRAAGPKLPARRLGVAYLPGQKELNPYLRLWYRHLEALGFQTVHRGRLDLGWLRASRGQVGFLHFHWNIHWFYEFHDPAPTRPRKRPWLGVVAFVARLVAAKALGYRIVWTIHEIYPHESPSRERDRAAAKALASLCHLLLAHDQATVERASRELGRSARRIEVVPHGSYVDFYPCGRSREDARARLGIDPTAFVFLAFGRIRHYKRLELLLEAFRDLRRDDAVLLVVGFPQATDVAERVRRAVVADPRIRLRDEQIQEEEVAELYGASDVAVLARDDGWTSGSLILALSQGVPVIAARAPAYEELLGGGAGWLYEPGDAASLRAALETAASDPVCVQAMGEAALLRARRLSWSEAAARAASLMLGRSS